MTTWFTSDTHYFHNNIIKYSERPFENVEEMNEALVQNWNNLVSVKDTVWHLGDVSFGSEEDTVNLMRRLNGTKHLLFGNHDDDRWNWEKIFKSVQHYKEMKLNKHKLIMFHYPILSWNGGHRGSWHLHGHCHSNLDNHNKGNTRLDVGVDGHNYKPINFDRIFEILNDNKFLSLDHHVSRSISEQLRAIGLKEV